MQFTYFQDKDDIKEKEYYSLLGKFNPMKTSITLELTDKIGNIQRNAQLKGLSSF